MNILVLCTGNSCRSQLAHAYLAHYTNPDFVNIYSAGIETHGVNPKAIATMKDDGIDISHYTSNLVSEYMNIQFDYVITVCDNANERCPIFPSTAKKIHHNFTDPAKAVGTEEEVMEQFSTVRNEIKNYMIDFVKTNLPSNYIQQLN